MLNRRVLKAAGAIAGAASLAAPFILTAHRARIGVLTVPLLKPGTLPRGRDSVSVLHITDMHLRPQQRAKAYWIQSLAELKPDLVINTGDNLGDPSAVPTVVRALEPLFQFPGVFVFGNNDYWAPKPPNVWSYLTGKTPSGKGKSKASPNPWRDLRSVFTEHGWVDLNNKGWDGMVGGVKASIWGVDDPHTHRDDPLSVKAPNPDADLTLALTHSPEPRVLDQFVHHRYSMAFAGHTHGGQICLPNGMPLVTNCGIGTGWARGLEYYIGMRLLVSEGLGESKYFPVRLFCPATAYLVKITEMSQEEWEEEMEDDMEYFDY